MGAKTTISIKGTPDILRMLAAVSPRDNQSILTRGLTRIILELQTEVTTSGDRIVHGRGDAPPLATKLTSRHGGSGLVGSITPDYSGLPRVVSLGSDLPYAGVHEDSPRAYLEPTYAKMARKGRLSEIMSAVIDAELQKVQPGNRRTLL